MTEIQGAFTGFDSAWTDNSKKPGAIASIIAKNDTLRLIRPIPATFEVAGTVISAFARDFSLHLVRID